MEQPKKPGAAPTKDISDLKARLGLRRPDAGGPGMAPGQAPVAFGSPMGGHPGAATLPGRPGPGFPGAAGAARPAAQAPMAQPVAAPAAAPAPNPFAGMQPQQGRFDLRSITLGAEPAVNQSSRL